MPNWTKAPPPSPDGFAFRILRTPASRPLEAVVTTTDVIGTRTHYVGNRTTPCEGPDACKYCEEGHSWRWHGYLAAILIGTLEHFIFEFTATASDTFRNYLKLHNSMRACQFRAHRPSGRHNGRVVIACKRLDEQRIRLPDPPNVAKALCHIWGVPYNPPETFRIPDRLGTQIGIHKPDGNGK